MLRSGWVLIALVAVGCVGKSKYEAVQAEREALQEQLTAAGEARTDLERQLTERGREVDDLNSSLRDLQAQVDSLTNQIGRIQAEKAKLISEGAGLKSSIEDMRTALAELEARRASAEARVAEFKDLLVRFKALIDAGKLRVKIVDGRMVVELATDVLFASGSAALSADGRKAIEEVAVVLASIPDRSYQVEGHTDDVPIATAQFPSNWELAAARALTVTKALAGAGVPPERVSAASYGATRPVATNRTKEGRASNRRIEIVVVPDLSTLPGFDQLQDLQ